MKTIRKHEEYRRLNSDNHAGLILQNLHPTATDTEFFQARTKQSLGYAGT